MARTSYDPKETTIKLRINEEMRNYIEKKSKQYGITMSEYLRKIIQRDKIQNSKDTKFNYSEYDFQKFFKK